MVVVIDLEEEEAKKTAAAAAAAAAAAKQTSCQTMSDASNSKQQPAETKPESGKTDKISQSDIPKSSDGKAQAAEASMKSKASAATPVSDVKSAIQDCEELPKLQSETTKTAPDYAAGEPDNKGTEAKSSGLSKSPSSGFSKSPSSDNKHKVKGQPSKGQSSSLCSEMKTGDLPSSPVSKATEKKDSKKCEVKQTTASSLEDNNASKTKKNEITSTKTSATKNNNSSECTSERKGEEAASKSLPDTNDSSESERKETPSTKVPTLGEDTKEEITSSKTASKNSFAEREGRETSDSKIKNGELDPLSEQSQTSPKSVQENKTSQKKLDSDALSKSEVTLEEKYEEGKQGDSGVKPKKTEVRSTSSCDKEEKKKPPTYSSFTSSLRDPTLQSWVRSVRELLKQTKQEDKVLEQLSKCKTDEERISLLYNLPCVHEVIRIKECYKSKDDEAAKSLRVQGNTAFQKKDYDAALNLYSDSILKAPSSGSTELTLAFANRSAVLYHKGQYVLCLQDIRQAFKYKYPDHLQYKLYERRGKACFCLRLKEDAICAFQDAINVLDKTQLDEKKLATVKTDLTKQLQKCSKLVSVESIKSAKDFNHNHGPVPLITDSRSTHIPCMGNSLVLKFSPSNGRGLYATRNIEVGEVLIIEKPYASVTLADHNLTHCHHCCNRVFCPLPCNTCSGVVFCSEQCQQMAWEYYHYAECKYHDLIQRSELGMGHLALRMVLKAGYKYLREYRKRTDDKPSDPLFLGCNEDDVYDSSDYHSVNSLVAHSDKRSSADLFRRTLGAVFMLKCIEKSGFFTRVEGDAGYDPNDDKLYIGGHILRHTQMLPCNAHEVSEFVYKTYSVQMSEPEEVGSAIYSTLSLINHSCDPSVVRHSYGNECVVRAIRNISKGDEIFDNYGVLYPVMSKPMRQEKLQSQYYFTCNCHACQCNWPMYEKIRSEFPVLKCKKCKIGRIMIPPDNQTTRAICEDCREVLDITPDLLHLSKSEGFYQGCLDKVLKGEERNEGLPYLVDHLRLIDRLLVRPWKDYNDCQEAIKQCYSTMANCHVLEEPDSDDEELLESERRRR